MGHTAKKKKHQKLITNIFEQVGKIPCLEDIKKMHTEQNKNGRIITHQFQITIMFSSCDKDMYTKNIVELSIVQNQFNKS